MVLQCTTRCFASGSAAKCSHQRGYWGGKVRSNHQKQFSAECIFWIILTGIPGEHLSIWAAGPLQWHLIKPPAPFRGTSCCKQFLSCYMLLLKGKHLQTSPVQVTSQSWTSGTAPLHKCVCSLSNGEMEWCPAVPCGALMPRYAMARHVCFGPEEGSILAKGLATNRGLSGRLDMLPNFRLKLDFPIVFWHVLCGCILSCDSQPAFKLCTAALCSSAGPQPAAQ